MQGGIRRGNRGVWKIPTLARVAKHRFVLGLIVLLLASFAARSMSETSSIVRYLLNELVDRMTDGTDRLKEEFRRVLPAHSIGALYRSTQVSLV